MAVIKTKGSGFSNKKADAYFGNYQSGLFSSGILSDNVNRNLDGKQYQDVFVVTNTFLFSNEKSTVAGVNFSTSTDGLGELGLSLGHIKYMAVRDFADASSYSISGVSLSVVKLNRVIQSASKNDDKALEASIYSGNDQFILGSGDDEAYGYAGRDAMKGRGGEDSLYGDRGNDNLNGGSGNDSLYGGSGLDKLNGGSGADRLEGGSGKDTIFGGGGDDKIVGGSGNDKMSGNAGRDVFIFDDGFGKDRISGFNENRDRLDFRKVNGLDDVSDLTINVGGGGVRVSAGSHNVVLVGLEAADIDDLSILV